MKKTNQNITVLGATGKIGGQLIKFYSNAGIPCTAITRDLSKSVDMPYVKWVQGDISNTEVLPDLLKGTEKLFLNSGVTDDMQKLQCAVIDAAKASGATQIVKLSTPGAISTTRDKVGLAHYQIEEYLKASGLQWNSLRPQAFMQNWLGDFANTLKNEHKIYSTAGEGRKAFMDTRDIAEVAFTLLQHPKDHVNKIIDLSGPELLSFATIAATFSEILEEKIKYVSQSPEEAKERMQKKNFPEWAIQISLIVEAGQKAGAGEKSFSNNVPEILGKPGRTLSDFVKDHISFFK